MQTPTPIPINAKQQRIDDFATFFHTHLIMTLARYNLNEIALSIKITENKKGYTNSHTIFH